MGSDITVAFDKNDEGFSYVDILPDNGAAFSWVDELAREMEERFGYKITDRIEGPDGTGICDIEIGEKLIRFLFDEGWGIEIHPHDKGAELDVIEMGVYLKEVLGKQGNDGTPEV